MTLAIISSDSVHSSAATHTQFLSLTCSESAGQQGRGGEKVIGGVEGLQLNGSGNFSSLTPLRGPGGKRYYVYKAYLAVSPSVTGYATVDVVLAKRCNAFLRAIQRGWQSRKPCWRYWACDSVKERCPPGSLWSGVHRIRGGIHSRKTDTSYRRRHLTAPSDPTNDDRHRDQMMTPMSFRATEITRPILSTCGRTSVSLEPGDFHNLRLASSGLDGHEPQTVTTGVSCRQNPFVRAHRTRTVPRQMDVRECRLVEVREDAARYLTS